MKISVRFQEELSKDFHATAQRCSKTESVYEGGMSGVSYRKLRTKHRGFMCELPQITQREITKNSNKNMAENSAHVL